MKNSRCLNPACPSYGTVGSRSIIHNGFYRTRSGKRRRYRCGECGKTFSSTKGTPYYRLQHRRATFDGVIALRVEGVSISSISRIKGIAWNTVARWLEKAAQVYRRFNHRRIAGFAAKELQADEIRTFVSNKKTPSWVFVTIEVWSRLWPSTVTGRRSYRNTHALFRDLSRRMNFERVVSKNTNELKTRLGCNKQVPWCINTGKSLIPLTLLFLAQKRNLLIPLELSGVMHQGSETVQAPATATASTDDVITVAADQTHRDLFIEEPLPVGPEMPHLPHRALPGVVDLAACLRPVEPGVQRHAGQDLSTHQRHQR